MSVWIQPKGGPKINLDLVREEINIAQGSPDTYCVDPDNALALLEALEGAVTLPELHEGDSIYAMGYNAGLSVARQNAGVVEDGT